MKNNARILLAIVWSVSSLVIIMAAIFYPIPEQNLGNVNTIIGFVLGTIVSTIVNYYFGSSKGSHDKTQMINGSN